MTRQRLYQLRQKEKGLCVKCPQIVDKASSNYCTYHLLMYDLKQNIHRIIKQYKQTNGIFP